jgi:hypothetical protein
MTRHEIAINKSFDDFTLEKGKIAILKKMWPVNLERSPRSATCQACRLIIPAKMNRFKVWTAIDPYRRYCITRLYHEHCLPRDMKEIIKKKEKALS